MEYRPLAYHQPINAPNQLFKKLEAKLNAYTSFRDMPEPQRKYELARVKKEIGQLNF